jgi:hypothetical protein
MAPLWIKQGVRYNGDIWLCISKLLYGQRDRKHIYIFIIEFMQNMLSQPNPGQGVPESSADLEPNVAGAEASSPKIISWI